MAQSYRRMAEEMVRTALNTNTATEHYATSRITHLPQHSSHRAERLGQTQLDRSLSDTTPAPSSRGKLEAQASPREVGALGEVAVADELDDATAESASGVHHTPGPLRVMQRSLAWQQQHLSKKSLLKQQKEENELVECTFSPSLAESGKNRRRSRSRSQPHARAFAHPPPGVVADMERELTFKPKTNTARVPPEKVRGRAQRWATADRYASCASKDSNSIGLQTRPASAHGALDGTSAASSFELDDATFISRPGSSDGRSSIMDVTQSVRASSINCRVGSTGSRGLSRHSVAARRDAESELTFRPVTNVKKRPPERIRAEAARYDMGIYRSYSADRLRRSSSIDAASWSSFDSFEDGADFTDELSSQSSKYMGRNTSTTFSWQNHQRMGSAEPEFFERQRDVLSRREAKREEVENTMYGYSHTPRLTDRSRCLAQKRIKEMRSPSSEMDARRNAGGRNSRVPSRTGEERGRRKKGSQEGECTFRPKITEGARKRAPRDVHELGEGERQRREQKLQQMQDQAKQREMQETARTHGGVRKPRSSVDEASTPRVCGPHYGVDRYKKKQEAREEERLQHERRKEQQELAQCTFTPETSSLPSYVFERPPSHKQQRAQHVDTGTAPRHTGHGGYIGYNPNIPRRETLIV